MFVLIDKVLAVNILGRFLLNNDKNIRLVLEILQLKKLMNFDDVI